jgi:hypothetical protein
MKDQSTATAGVRGQEAGTPRAEAARREEVARRREGAPDLKGNPEEVAKAARGVLILVLTRHYLGPDRALSGIRAASMAKTATRNRLSLQFLSPEPEPRRRRHQKVSPAASAPS